MIKKEGGCEEEGTAHFSKIALRINAAIDKCVWERERKKKRGREILNRRSIQSILKTALKDSATLSVDVIKIQLQFIEDLAIAISSSE